MAAASRRCTPTSHAAPGRRLVGVEAVIDKDLASALLAADLHADALLIVTDVDAVYTGWGTPDQRAIRRATPAALRHAGVRSRARWARRSRRVRVCRADRVGFAAIGSMSDTPALLRGEAGTIVTREADGLEYAAAGVGAESLGG